MLQQQEVNTGSISLNDYSNSEQLAEQLASTVACQLRQGIDKHGVASLAVSGGSTPKVFFRVLSSHQLPWEKVVVTLVDERWVEPQHSDSNARLVAENLLRHKAQKARFIALKNRGETPFEGEDELEQSLRELPLPFDAVVLGMGVDGHTASFFPGADNLADALDMHSQRICLATRPPMAVHGRMTLTLPAILNTRFLALHFEGASKWQIFQKALGAASRGTYPVSAVLQQDKVPVNVFYTRGGE
ncbi:6-phosphogluconolactonase [bacterium SCSIO 12696]|nr:6-phosphogluconolactonase [bacterium SCSIO 12696]